LFGDDVFQSPILVLELLQPLHLAELHTAVLRFPAVTRLFGDPVGPTQVRPEESCVNGNIIVMIMNLWNCLLSIIKRRQFMRWWNGE
jgi:hypothetical protein